MKVPEIDLTLLKSRRSFLRIAAAAALPAAARGRELAASNPAGLQRALKDARAGDTIVLADGDWTDADILFEGEGTAAAPITLRAQTPGKAILKGRSRLRMAGSYLVADGLCFRDGFIKDHIIAFRSSPERVANHCRLTNSAIVDYSVPDKQTDTKWVSLYGSHNRVDHCYLRGKTNAGTTLVVWLSDPPNYHQIDHNHFGPRPRLGFNGGETIRVGTSDWSMYDSHTLVEENYFEGCSGEIEIISNKSCENVYRNNTFVDCEGTLTLRHGNRCTVEGNFFLGHHKRETGGIRVIGEDHKILRNYLEALEGDRARSAISMMNGIPDSPLNGYFQVKRARVAFNTIIDCKSSITIGIVSGNPKGGVLGPEDCVFANNIVRSASAPLITESTPPIRMTWEGNVMYGAELGIAGTKGIRIEDPRVRADGARRPLTPGETGPAWMRRPG
jgi:poly(beta-D-mannuronate) lyase